MSKKKIVNNVDKDIKVGDLVCMKGDSVHSIQSKYLNEEGYVDEVIEIGDDNYVYKIKLLNGKKVPYEIFEDELELI